MQHGGRATLDYEFTERPVSAANIDPTQSWSRFQPVEKNLAREPAPSPHHPLVAGSIIEANLLVCHGKVLPYDSLNLA
jgi:hypothetical protein